LILSTKFRWPSENIDEALADYASNTKTITTFGSIRGFCRDPKDDMVLECAVLAGAEIIVSGDKYLLTMDPFRGIRILSPREFLTFQEGKTNGS